MEEISTSSPVAAGQQQKACISCGNPQILHGYPNALCEECREKYIKFPVPLWVKAFGGALALLVIFLLFNLPKTLSAGIGYERGIKAEEAKKYETEQQEMERVVQAMPAYTEAKAHLLIAAFYNNDLGTIAGMAQQLSGKKIDDEELFRETDAMLTKSDSYFPTDSFAALLKKYPDSTGGIPDAAFKRFVLQTPDDLFAKMRYASVLDNEKNYTASDSMLQVVLQKDAAYIPALEFIEGLKRVMNDTKASFDYCDKLLAINHESLFALAGKARTFLKTNQPKQALQYALQAYNIKPTDGYSYATLVMAYHFNNMPKERDALIDKAKKSKDPVIEGYMKYALDVINKKDQL